MDGGGISGNEIVFRAQANDRVRWGIYRATFQIPDDDGDGVWNDEDVCPNTIVGVEVDDFGCPPIVPGDFDRDGDVDEADLDHFMECALGPALPQTDLHCARAKLDDDDDVDQSDFGIFQRCISGTSIPADPHRAVD